jgi:uncharacterized protein (DUF952 family)
MIYHITYKHVWDAARMEGEYQGDTLISEGFIHCSDEDQVVSVANTRFKGVTGLVLLCIDDARVRPKILRENLEGGHILFPHIYGPLNLDAVVRVENFHPAAKTGLFDLPTNLPNNEGA